MAINNFPTKATIRRALDAIVCAGFTPGAIEITATGGVRVEIANKDGQGAADTFSIWEENDNAHQAQGVTPGS
jgi:hypothetical protein